MVLNEENSDDTNVITLISCDDVSFQIPKAAAMRSGFIRDSLGFDEEEEEPPEDGYDPVNVLRVRGACLQKVIEFLNHYEDEPMREIPKPLDGNSFKEVVRQNWYRDFITRCGGSATAPGTDGEHLETENAEDESGDANRKMVFELLAAANYMTIKPLLELICLWVTFQLQGQNAEQIRVFLNLPQLTPEEEAMAREEHPWIFEES